MGDTVKKIKEMRFKREKDLEAVWNVINDAELALQDSSRLLSDSLIKESVIGAVGATIGAGIGFAGLYFAGTVVGLSAVGVTSGLAALGAIIGGGLAAGVGVVAAPAVALGAAGVGIASHVKKQKLREAKELAYKNALAKQTAIVKALKEEMNADKERIDYLTGLNVLLQAAINDLRHDLDLTA